MFLQRVCCDGEVVAFSVVSVFLMLVRASPGAGTLVSFTGFLLNMGPGEVLFPHDGPLW